MKIQAIRIKNLASLDGITEVDFTKEPLLSVGIFAITGPTGSGKSTILDALCLALYGKTPRYRLAEQVEITDVKGSTIKQDDVRAILRDGASDGFAEVEFLGVDGDIYKSNWSVRRAYNKVDGSLQAYNISLKNITTDKDVQGTKSEVLNEIIRVVGLNYEQFTRSVLLAQGDFTAFMKAKKDEKSSLLEKLTGTNIYSEISKKIHENHKEEQQKLRELNIQCEGIVVLTTEEENALEEKQIFKKKEIGLKEEQLTKWNKEVNWHEQDLKWKERLEAASLNYDQASAAKNEAASKETMFKQILSVQSIKPIFNDLKYTQEQVDFIGKKKEEFSVKLKALEDQKKTERLSFDQANNNANTKKLEEEKAFPLLNEAKKLDVQLEEKTNHIKQSTEELELIVKKEAEQKEELSRVEINLDELKKQIDELSKWRKENESRQPIAEQEVMILSKLDDIKQTSRNIQSYEDQLLEAEKQIEKCQDINTEIEKQRVLIHAEIQQEQNDFTSLGTDLSHVFIEELEQQESEYKNTIEDLVSAHAHWKLLYTTIKERDVLSEKLQNNKELLEKNKKELTQEEKQVELKKTERDTSLKMLEKAKIIAAGNVEGLRNLLVSEEPCPVCGSTNHPYSTHDPKVNLVISELQINYNRVQQEYDQQVTLQSKLKQVCDDLEQRIKEFEEALSLKDISIQGLEKEWLQFNIHEECNKLPIDSRAKWLEKQLQENKNEINQVRTQIKSYKILKEQCEATKTALTELDKKLNDIENQRKDNQRIEDTSLEKKESTQISIKQENENLEKLKNALSKYFISEYWFKNWEADPIKFAKRIKEFALNWKNNTTKLDEGVKNEGILLEKKSGLLSQLENLLLDIQNQELKISELKRSNQQLLDTRKSIFGGSPAEEVENKLKDAVKAADQVLEQHKKTLEEVESEMTRLNAQLEQLENDWERFSKEESIHKLELVKWLEKHNQENENKLTEEELKPLLKYSDEWIEIERTELGKLDEVLIQAKSILEETQKLIQLHKEQRLSEKTLEDLTELIEEAQEEQKQSEKALAEIEVKVHQDQTNKKQLGGLLKKIEFQASILDDWSKLNDIIGSADGKKFRQIAQEYTLDILLNYANVHLEVLSKRYVLQRIPESLGLQVIDQDMGDEIRTVYSLSGGESFLVSLALALGLASLSSSRMKVESLFIDEGFGSLDPLTLNIAMDALERLQNQGRKVGVISHVQEMTERIPVQIKVSKQQSGKSKVGVLSY